MRTNIWLPKEEAESIRKSAKEATKSGGVGAYLVLLHKEKIKQQGGL